MTRFYTSYVTSSPLDDGNLRQALSPRIVCHPLSHYPDIIRIRVLRYPCVSLHVLTEEFPFVTDSTPGSLLILIQFSLYLFWKSVFFVVDVSRPPRLPYRLNLLSHFGPAFRCNHANLKIWFTKRHLFTILVSLLYYTKYILSTNLSTKTDFTPVIWLLLVLSIWSTTVTTIESPQLQSVDYYCSQLGVYFSLSHLLPSTESLLNRNLLI